MPAFIFGGTSDIGQAIAEAWLRDGAREIDLSGRDAERLARIAADLRTRFPAEVRTHVVDVRDTAALQALWDRLDPRPTVVVYVAGYMASQSAAQEDCGLVREMLEVNFLGAATVFELAAREFSVRGAGTIAGISSVAGERGRGSNYLYGASKAAFTVYLSGLRNRLHGSGVDVITVLPGFVATRMTAHLTLPGLLTCAPQEVARALLLAIRRRRPVVYVNGIWRLIMAMVRAIPESLFVRTHL